MVVHAKTKAQKEKKDLIETKDKIKLSYDRKKEGIFTEKEKTNLTRLEEVKRKLLEHEEAEKRLKSWAL